MLEAGVWLTAMGCGAIVDRGHRIANASVSTGDELKLSLTVVTGLTPLVWFTDIASRGR